MIPTATASDMAAVSNTVIISQGPLACISLGYRTTEEEPTYYFLTHPEHKTRSFPDNLGAHGLGKCLFH